MRGRPPPIVFYSYSHRDEALRQRLSAHLSGMEREGEIAGWHDRRISPGSDWSAEIDDRIGRADIILLLVSADFIASDYCWGVEATRALERHDRGEAIVIPVIIRPVDWKHTSLGRLQALPRTGRAITTFSNRDEAWTDVAQSLRSVVRTFTARSGAGDAAQPEEPSGGQRRHDGAPTLEFAHIGVTDLSPRWTESAHDTAFCPFWGACGRLIHLEDFVFGADLTLDVVVLNRRGSPVVLSAVGAEVVDAVNIAYVYGVPEAAKLARATDEHVVDMPDMRVESDPERWGDPVPAAVRRTVLKRLDDPLYLPSRAPYRYILRLANYQARVPNHARLRLVAEAGEEVATSSLLHVFTW